MPKRTKKSAKAAPGFVKTREGNTRNPETGFGGSRGTALEGDWLNVAMAVGGVQALADALGVSYPTLYRWAVKGEAVNNSAKIILGMICAQRNLPNPAVSVK